MSGERPRFDLTKEPWIPCETLAGARLCLGFEDVLLRAHELSAVSDESPLSTAMLHRLLLAIVHRVFRGPRSLDHWVELWRQPRFDAAAVNRYLGEWRHRFDLFDADRPFLQVPKLRDLLVAERDGKNAEDLPASRLALERSGYAGAVDLLAHGGDEAPIAPARAALDMLGFLGFGPGGRILNDSGYPKACPLRAGAAVLVRGASLHRTLLLNLMVLTKDRPLPSHDDAPAWEHERFVQRGKRPVRGWLDALSWQARRVELIPDPARGSPRVLRVVTGVGDEPAGDWHEPMHAIFVRDAKRGPEAVRFLPDKATWRDATAIFQSVAQGEGFRRPAVCNQLAALVERDVLGRAETFALDLYGLASNQAAIDLWRAERMSLPLRLLTDPERLDVVRNAVDAAEDAERALGKSVWVLAAAALAGGDRSPDKKDIGALTDRLAARPAYWSALGAGFDALLRDVAAADDPEVVLLKWKFGARKQAQRALQRAADQLGTSAHALRARALAERHIWKALEGLTPPPTAMQEGAPS